MMITQQDAAYLLLCVQSHIALVSKVSLADYPEVRNELNEGLKSIGSPATVTEQGQYLISLEAIAQRMHRYAQP